MKKFACSLFCLILALIIVTAQPLSLVSYATPATDELEAQIAANEAQIQENKKKLESLKNEKDSKQEYLETLEDQIDAISQKAANIQTQKETLNSSIATLDNELTQLENEVDMLNSDIEKYENEITETENSITLTSDNLAKKIRSSYVNGYESTFKILMGSKSLASFLTRLEFMKRTSEQDKKIITEFRDKVVKIKEDKKLLEESRNELLEKKSEISAKKKEYQANISALEIAESEYEASMAEMEVQYAEVETVMAQIDKSSAEYQSYISELEAENAKADAEIDRILSEYYATSVQQTTTRLDASNANPNSTAGPSYQGTGNWYWPLGDRWCYISSYFGPRSAPVAGASTNHGAIDIAGGNGALHGAPVYASRSGTVITAVTSDSGYGIYVIIDHGDGYTTLYAHMSTRYVSTGDYVTQGQMIGRVGNTGTSSKSHLHFEVRYYGEKKDPLNYVKNPN